MKFLVSKTYNIITPESVENGDFAESGFEYKNLEMDLRSLIDEIKDGGFTENAGRWLSTPDPERDFQTGEEIYYNLHIETTPKNYDRICKLAGVN